MTGKTRDDTYSHKVDKELTEREITSDLVKGKLYNRKADTTDLRDQS